MLYKHNPHRVCLLRSYILSKRINITSFIFIYSYIPHPQVRHIYVCLLCSYVNIAYMVQLPSDYVHHHSSNTDWRTPVQIETQARIQPLLQSDTLSYPSHVDCLVHPLTLTVVNSRIAFIKLVYGPRYQLTNLHVFHCICVLGLMFFKYRSIYILNYIFTYSHY